MNRIKRFFLTLYYKLKFRHTPNIIFVNRYVRVSPQLYNRETYQIRPFVRQPAGIDDTAFVGDVEFDKW